MNKKEKIPWEPVKMENILQVQIVEYIGEDEAHYQYRAISSMDTQLSRSLVRGQRVRIVFELMEDK